MELRTTEVLFFFIILIMRRLFELFQLSIGSLPGLYLNPYLILNFLNISSLPLYFYSTLLSSSQEYLVVHISLILKLSLFNFFNSNNTIFSLSFTPSLFNIISLTRREINLGIRFQFHLVLSFCFFFSFSKEALHFQIQFT